jgi:hypothetical protein
MSNASIAWDLVYSHSYQQAFIVMKFQNISLKSEFHK